MRKLTTASQTAVYNIRGRLRKDMRILALTHRGCDVARGCGCLVDKALIALVQAERLLFDAELDSFSDPKSPRRIVQDDNSITIEAGDDAVEP